MAISERIESASQSRIQKVVLPETARSQRVWTFVFLDIIALSMLDSVICHALYGALPLYVESLGGKAAFSGLLTAIFALAAGVGRILTGMVAGRYGCRLVLIWGGILLAAANLTPLALPALGVLLGVRFLQGVGFSGISTASANASAEVLPRQRLGEGMGYYGLGQSLSTVIGPALGYFLFHFGQKSVWGNDILWYGLTLISLVLIGLAYVCCYERQPVEPRGETADSQPRKVPAAETHSRFAVRTLLARMIDAFFEPGALSMALVCGLFMVSASFYSSFLMLFAQRNGIPNPVFFFGGTAAAMFAVRLFAGKLGDQFPPLRVLIPCLLIGMLSFLLTIPARSTAMLALTGTLYGISLGIGFPLLNTLAYRMTHPSRWHASTATFFLGCDLGWAAGSYLWGTIIDWRGFTAALLASGVLMLFTSALAVRFLYGKRFS